MNALLAAAASAATILTLVVAVLAYRAGRAKVVVDERYHHQWLPVYTEALLRACRDQFEELEGVPDRPLPVLWPKVLESSKAGFDGDERIRGVLELKVTNRGTITVDRVTIRSRNARCVRVEREGEYRTTIGASSQMDHLLPGEDATVLMWTTDFATPGALLYDEPSILLSNGRVRRRKQAYAPTPLVVAWAMKEAVLAIVLSATLGPLVIFPLVRLLDR